MSTGGWIALALGAVVVVGVGVYLLASGNNASGTSSQSSLQGGAAQQGNNDVTAIAGVVSSVAGSIGAIFGPGGAGAGGTPTTGNRTGGSSTSLLSRNP